MQAYYDKTFQKNIMREKLDAFYTMYAPQKLEPDRARAKLNWANGVMPGAQVYEQKLEPYLTRAKLLTWANDVMPVLSSEEWWDSIAENGHYYSYVFDRS